jgi:hypothetical protein
MKNDLSSFPGKICSLTMKTGNPGISVFNRFAQYSMALDFPRLYGAASQHPGTFK